MKSHWPDRSARHCEAPDRERKSGRPQADCPPTWMVRVPPAARVHWGRRPPAPGQRLIKLLRRSAGHPSRQRVRPSASAICILVELPPGISTFSRFSNGAGRDRAPPRQVGHHRWKSRPDGTPAKAAKAVIPAVDQAATALGAEVNYIEVQGEFIGTQLETGTDAEQRADARRVYETVFAELQNQPGLEGARARSVWQDAHDYWCAATAQDEEPVGQSGALGMTAASSVVTPLTGEARSATSRCRARRRWRCSRRRRAPAFGGGRRDYAAVAPAGRCGSYGT